MSEQPPQQFNQSLNISDSILETVQIGGIAGRDLNLTQIQGGVGVINVFGKVQVDQAPLSEAKPLSQKEYQWRRVLLSKVRQFWIDGVLTKSLHTQVLIELGLEYRSDYIPSPLEGVEEFPSDSRQVFTAGTSAAGIFEGIGAGRTLLILGEPGAGKTVTLLKLAESLIARSENDLSQPLPVVVNLSSWAKQRKSIADWLAQELYETFQVSKSLGKTWIDEEQLILCLDGLDEVAAKHRNACVQTLNQFIQEYGRTEMVVCCRVREYEALSKRLKLRNAIYVQPLTPKQIDQYLDKAGEQLAALTTLLYQNPEIKAFASSPLILSVMSLAYQGCSLGEFTQLGTAVAFHQRLFDAYIERMFTRRGTTQKYPKEQAKCWLVWMAQRMVQASQTVFLIERMQPSWFQTRLQRIWYQLGSVLIFWLIFWLSNGLFYGLSSELRIGGLIIGLIVGLIPAFSVGDIEPVESLSWSWQEAISGLIVGLIVGPLLGLIAVGMGGGLIVGLVGGLIVGLLLGLRGPEMTKKVKPNQGIWRSTQHALALTPIVGLLFGLTFGLGGGLTFGLIDGPNLGLNLGLISGLIGGGSASIRHFALRLMLYRMRVIPWNYARFLNHAADLIFLQKVGGGYIFVHRMLLEHFAAMELDRVQD